LREDQISQINENDSHKNYELSGQKSDCQLLGFLQPGGILVMSHGSGKNAAQGAIVAMPIAQLFMQHKKRTDS
jgi:hypothetical protein